jgi:tetratricopeptide (TPR) repeat protein
VPGSARWQRHVPRLAELGPQTAATRIDAELNLGRHGDVIAELRQLAATHPLREQLHALLMLALYRDGQQAEALAAYRRVRRALIDDLGTEPGPELRRLEQRILAADPAIDAPLPPAGAAVPAAPEVEQPASVTGPPRVVPRQLPADVSAFSGREAELAVPPMTPLAHGHSTQRRWPSQPISARSTSRARAHEGLAASYEAAGHPDRAREHWQQATARYAALGVPEAGADPGPPRCHERAWRFAVITQWRVWLDRTWLRETAAQRLGEPRSWWWTDRVRLAIR